MKIILTSIFVDDQEKALKFYTEKLGFVKKSDLSAGEYRWLTVVSPEDPGGTELLLEPNENPVAQAYQRGIFEQGIPAASFGVEDTHAEYERLKSLGREVHDGADKGHRSGDNSSLRRHLRQPHPDSDNAKMN